MSETPRTIIEFVDHPGTDLCHKTNQVKINGTPVLVEANGIDVSVGGRDATVVTLRILPTEIHFNHPPKE